MYIFNFKIINYSLLQIPFKIRDNEYTEKKLNQEESSIANITISFNVDTLFFCLQN